MIPASPPDFLPTRPQPQAAPPHAPVSASWVREVVRVATLRRPRLEGLHATPLGLVVLLLLSTAFYALEQRLLIDGPAHFRPEALQSGWLGTLLGVALCWAVARHATSRPATATLIGLVLGQQALIAGVGALMLVPLVRSGALQAWPADASQALLWGLWLGPWVLSAVAQAVLLVRLLPIGTLARGGVPLAVMLIHGLAWWWPPEDLWLPQPIEAGAAGEAHPVLALSDAVIEQQPALLAAGLAGLLPQRPGVVDLYSLTFAPYDDEDVFRRESAMVDEVMRERFDAAGRSLQLVNNPATALTLPWATAGNLRRAIEGAAARMDRDEDILFLHLTSHGARDGQLAAALGPVAIEPVTPQALAGWLDAAGVRHAIVSISACYSGSWIAPLRADGRLVMTAADADHTSYGCGRRSELTFFGRAMYDEQLRRDTRSFEQAHAAARDVIARREQEAGKDDGYSNPQIAFGEALRAPLAQLVQRLEAEAVPARAIPAASAPAGRPTP